MNTEYLLLAFLLTLFAGLATGIGSILTLFVKRTNLKFLSIALGFSAGVMIFVSMIEIFPKAQEYLIAEMGITYGSWITAIAFFSGIIFIAIIDRIIPSINNPHHQPIDINQDNYSQQNKEDIKRRGLERMGIFTAIAIAIHNFPEGIATFFATLSDPSLGVAIAIAIAIHNIPEGIAVSAPIYFATGSKKKAFWYSFLSGLAEPIGAIIAFLILMPFLTPAMFGILFAAVAGIMVFISLDQLLPMAREYSQGHLPIYGVVAGMMIMSLSLLLIA